MVGYKVAFVPFENGKPAGPMEDIITGFIADESKFEAYGRPVGVTELPDGIIASRRLQPVEKYGVRLPKGDNKLEAKMQRDEM